MAARINPFVRACPGGLRERELNKKAVNQRPFTATKKIHQD
jgi:hypothetical protein